MIKINDDIKVKVTSELWGDQIIATMKDIRDQAKIFSEDIPVTVKIYGDKVIDSNGIIVGEVIT
jgi:hypothetical protein